MLSLLCVGFGGFLGSVSRYLIGNIVNVVFFAGLKFPLSTLIVNILGSFIIGFLLPFLDANGLGHERQKLFIVTGFLGGFTTFSAFSLETFLLLKEGSITYALANVLAQLVFGFGAVLLGYAVAKTIVS